MKCQIVSQITLLLPILDKWMLQAAQRELGEVFLDMALSHQDHLMGMMQEIMTSEDFADVTLITDDKKTLKAHRSFVFKTFYKLRQTKQ